MFGLDEGIGKPVKNPVAWKSSGVAGFVSQVNVTITPALCCLAAVLIVTSRSTGLGFS
jgi:hypothetical protein